MSATARSAVPPGVAGDKSKPFFDTGECTLALKGGAYTTYRKAACRIELPENENKKTFSFHWLNQHPTTSQIRSEPMNIHVTITYERWLEDDASRNIERDGCFATIRDPRAELGKELKVGIPAELARAALMGGDMFWALDRAVQLLSIDEMRNNPNVPLLEAVDHCRTLEMLGLAMEVIYLRRLMVEREVRGTLRNP